MSAACPDISLKHLNGAFLYSGANCGRRWSLQPLVTGGFGCVRSVVGVYSARRCLLRGHHLAMASSRERNVELVCIKGILLWTLKYIRLKQRFTRSRFLKNGSLFFMRFYINSVLQKIRVLFILNQYLSKQCSLFSTLSLCIFLMRFLHSISTVLKKSPCLLKYYFS